MSQSKQLVFLDSDILIAVYDNSDLLRTINHISNLDRFQIVTSITVLGETFFKAMDKENTEGIILTTLANIRGWKTDIILPDASVSKLCYEMNIDREDTRMMSQVTDKVHLGYAISQECKYFLTHDRGLIQYRIPEKLHEAKFFKPDTLTPNDFHDRHLRR